jgi:hypothetical protein
MPYIGPDTVTLIRRTATGGVDANNQLTYDETDVPKTNAAVTVATGFATGSQPTDTTEGSFDVYEMKAMLPVDPDTTALTGDDAISFAGIVYELNHGAIVKTDLKGNPDHVRITGSAEMINTRSMEQVTVTPAGGRDDTGQPVAQGTPFNVMAYAVTAGSTSRKFGVAGDVDEADYTVALPIDTPVKDGDLVTVRGRTGYARVVSDFQRWSDRQIKVVTVATTTGGHVV